MPAEQGHDGRSVLGHGDDGWLVGLARQNRGEAADQNAGSAEPDHRMPAKKEIAQMRAGVREVLAACMYAALNDAGDPDGQRICGRQRDDDRVRRHGDRSPG